jgi:hypothetical protein
MPQLPHNIAFRTTDGEANHYEIVFEDTRPQKVGAMGASINDEDVVEKPGEKWVATGAVGAGVDAYAYGGVRGEMRFENPEVVEVNVNDNGWVAGEKWARLVPLTESTEGTAGSGDEPTDSGGGSAEPAAWKEVDGPIVETSPGSGVVNRRRVTTADETVVVGHGEFGTGRGTEADPFGTLMDALNYMPERIEHMYVIQLTQGVHDNEPGDSVTTSTHQTIGHANAKPLIRGDPENPEDYVIDVSQLNIGFKGAVISTKFVGVTIRGTPQLYEGNVTFEDCIIDPGNRWGNGRNYAFDCYGGKACFLNCEIQGENAAAVANLVYGGEFQTLGRTTIDAGNTTLGSAGGGGGRIVLHPGTELTCGRITDGWEPATVVVDDVSGDVTDGHPPGMSGRVE